MKQIASFLTGFNAVILGLIIFVSYRYFEVQLLFYRYLPLGESTRSIASSLVAVVVVFSLLVFSSHIDRFKLSQNDSGNWIKWVMFLFTLFINVFFWEVWNYENTYNLGLKHSWLVIVFKVVVSIFFAVFDYSFNHLFISNWNDSQIVAKAEHGIAKLRRKLSQYEQEVSQVQQKVSEGRAKLSKIIAMNDPKVCPRCGQTFDNPNQRNGHLRSCKKHLNDTIEKMALDVRSNNHSINV